MPEIKYNLLKKYLKDLKGDSKIQFSQIYLIFGEELLVKTTYDDLLQALLPSANRTANYNPMDGTIENINDVIERVNTFSLMSGIKVVAMRESRIHRCSTHCRRSVSKTERLLAFSALFVGRLKGGLALVNVAASILLR